MDWDMKMPYWGDLAELSQNAGGPSFNPSTAAGAPDCSVDLKLGGLGEYGKLERWKEQKRPVPSPVKRPRAPGNAGQVPSCLVDGCKSDLGKGREYHRRHKVCEIHSKTQMVMVGGQEQRFCQQCSRFHLIGEFDEVKRSCRKRLDGHNRRRRKPQPDPMSSGRLFSNDIGGRFASFPPLFPSASLENNWASGREHNLPGSFSISFKDGKKFPFLQDSDGDSATGMAFGSSGCQRLLKTIPCSSQPFNSDCALSLLSSPANNVAIYPGKNRIPMGQPLVPSLPFDGLGQCSGSQASSGVSATGLSCSGMEDEPGGGAVFVLDGGDPDLHCQGFFHVGDEGSSEGTSLALPFSWW